MSDVDPNDSNSLLERAGASDESLQKVHASLVSDNPELKHGKTRLPLVMLGFISVMVFIAAIYIVRNRGGFDPLAYDARFDPRTAVKATVAAVDPVKEGEKLFGQICATCHQATGMGVPGVFPPLAGSEWVNGSEDRVIRIVLSGLGGPVKVSGVEYGQAAMPAFGPGGYGWTDEKIAYVLTYVRQSWGNKGAAIDPAKVTAIRNTIGQHKPWTSEELQAIP